MEVYVESKREDVTHVSGRRETIHGQRVVIYNKHKKVLAVVKVARVKKYQQGTDECMYKVTLEVCRINKDFKRYLELKYGGLTYDLLEKCIEPFINTEDGEYRVSVI